MPPKAPAKKAGPPPGLNAIKAKLAKQKEAEEERKRKEEEEKKRLEEEMRRIEEEERKAEQKKVHVATKGPQMSAKQRAEMQRKLDSLKKSGLVPTGVDPEDDSPQVVDRKQYGKKKQPVKKKEAVEEAATPTTVEYVPLQSAKDHTESEETDGSSDNENHGMMASWEDLVVDEDAQQKAAVLKDEEIARLTIISDEKTAIDELNALRTKELHDLSLSTEKELRSPICCVLGHVDAGKTSFLDKLRRTNLQGAEAGGITQQIGSTFFPLSSIEEKTKAMAEQNKFSVRIPGLLLIDTPGHESFTNLRSRGSSLCDIAIVIIDIMKGVEPQTKESFHLLREKKCSFIVAMNKVDRIYGWKSTPDLPIQDCLKKQENYVVQEYNSRVAFVNQQLMEEGFNSALYYQNKNFQKNVSLVPISASSGEGIPDLLVLLVQLMQKFVSGRISSTADEFRCSVLEVKKMEGQGTTLDVILVNGSLRVGDTIVVCGLSGPIVTTIRALMTPQPCRENRSKGEFVSHQQVFASCGVKVACHNLEDAVAGSPLLVLENPTDEAAKESACNEVMNDLEALKKSLQLKPIGICVQASSMGSLEALLGFLREHKVDVAHVAIGPLHKRHILNAILIKEKTPEKAAILAFDVPITKEAQALADTNKIPVFEGDVIYRLLENFHKHCEAQKKQAKEANRKIAVFPASFKVLKTFRSTDPIILGVEVMRGQLRPHSPCFTMKGEEAQPVGTITSIEHENSTVEKATVGQVVAIKVQPAHPQLAIGRHVSTNNLFHSHLTRQSINALKESFRDEMQPDDWKLVIELKRTLSIM